MSVLARLWNRADTTENFTGLSHPPGWFVDWGGGGSDTASGVTVNARSAMQYTPFWACVRIISGTLAALPFVVYRSLASGGRQRVPDHPVYRLIHDRPNPYVGAVKLKEVLQAHVLCYGNGYAEIQRNGYGQAVGLWPMLPTRVRRRIRTDGTLYYEVTLPVGDTVALPDENVLHLKGLGFDGYTGYDVVSMHRRALGYGIAAREYASSFFGHGAKISGFLIHPKNMTKEAQGRLEEKTQEKIGSLTNAHRFMLLEEDLKWQPISVEPEKAQAIEAQKFTVDDCARIFNMPPHKIASLQLAAGTANIEEQNIDFLCTTMLYWFRTWEEEINYKLFDVAERWVTFAEILADAMLRGNMQARYAAYGTARQWGFMSVNDILRRENMNPIGEEGDIYLEPENMRPAGSYQPKSYRTGQVRAAHRDLLAGQWLRIITKQTGALEKGVGSDFWPGHRDYCLRVLLDAAAAWAAVCGARRATAADILKSTVAANVGPHRILDASDAGRLADHLLDAIASQPPVETGGCL